MKTVYKYPIPTYGEIMMPAGAEILSCAFQNRSLYMWAKVEASNQSEYRTFAVYGTGHEIQEPNLLFIGTVFLDDLVFHVFEVTPPSKED